MASKKETITVDARKGADDVTGMFAKWEKQLEKLERRIASLGKNLDPLTSIAQTEGSAGYGKGLEAQFANASSTADLNRNVKQVGRADNILYQRALDDLNPGTTQETRKDNASERNRVGAAASAQRAAAKVTSTSASIDYENKVGRGKRIDASAKRTAQFGKWTDPQIHAFRMGAAADELVAAQAKEAWTSSLFGNMDPMQRQQWRRGYKQQGQADQLQHVTDMAGAEGMTVAQKKDHQRQMKELHLKELGMRKEISAEKKKERDEARSNNQMSNLLTGLVPGGSAMQRLNGLFPGASARMGQFRGFLGQRMEATALGAGSVGMAGLRGQFGLMGSGMGALGGASLGAMAAGVVGGVGLAAGVGELGVHAARSLYAPSVGRLTNLEQQLSHGFGAGGVGRTSDWMQSQTTKRLMGQGFQQAGMAESYMAYVRSRGTRGGAGQAAFDSMETSMRYGVGGGLLGSLDAAAGEGAGKRAVRGLYNSGLTGDALSDAMSGLGSTAARAASHGIKYNTDSYTNMSQNLAGNRAFGGGRNGGNLATQRLAGMGDSVMGGIESAMGSISDMAVFAQAASGGGDITDIAHRLRGMTPEQKLAAQTKQLGRGNTKYGLVGQGFSPDQAAALAAYRGGQAGPGEEPPLFRMSYGAISGKKDYAMDLEASQKGSTAESIAQRDSDITLIAAKIVEIAGFVKSYANITKKGTSWFAE